MTSYKPEVIADSSGKWAGNGLTFNTEMEAHDYVKDLEWRWTSVRETRVVEVDEPATHYWDLDKRSAGRIADLPEPTDAEYDAEFAKFLKEKGDQNG
jgi:hypothetical protein